MNTNNDLKRRLREKINAKKNARSSNHTLKIQQNKQKTPMNGFRLNNNNDIRTVSISLMNDVEMLHKKGVDNPVKKNKVLAPKYESFVKNYFGIYMGIIKRQLPMGVLDMMLSQKNKIDTGELSEEKASLQMGNIIAKKLNVDVDKLVKSAEVNKQKLEKK